MSTRFLTLFAICCAVPAIAQITSISAPHFGGITTITPTYQGYSYTTIGGPHSGDFGNVQVTGGNVSGIAVGPRGGTYPIVSPTAVTPIMAAPAVETVSVPSYIPVPVGYVPRRTPAQALHAQAKPSAPPYPKWKAEQETKEFNQLFLRVTDRKRFWSDFYRDWKVAPKTPIPLVYMIPYLRLWIDRNP